MGMTCERLHLALAFLRAGCPLPHRLIFPLKVCGQCQWRKPGAEFLGGRNFFRRPRWRFFWKNFHFSGKISDDLSYRPGFSNFHWFPFFRIFILLNVVQDPSYMTLSSQEKLLFYSFHTFAHIRQHYFSKYWGDECMGRPPPQIVGGTVPQSP